MSTSVHYLTINEAYSGQRIDNFLLTYLKGVPKSHIYRLLRKGEVRINKKRVKPDYRLVTGDQLRVPPVRRTVKSPRVSSATEPLLKTVLYEDEHLLVINKPSGAAVHGGSGIEQGVIERLRQARPDLTFLDLVHRLDRETSGVLLLAKKRSTLTELHRLFRDGEIIKTYIALVKGRWPKRQTKVALPLAKNELVSGERMVKVREEGKASLTLFQVERYFEEASLVIATLKSGRTHQIRVHAEAMDHPIAGDQKYGDREFNKQLRAMGLRRLFLHANRLQFSLLGKEYVFEAVLPEELSEVLGGLR